MVVLAVKPQMMEEAIADLGALAGPDTAFLSIAAGLSTAWLGARLGDARGGHVERRLRGASARVTPRDDDDDAASSPRDQRRARAAAASEASEASDGDDGGVGAGAASSAAEGASAPFAYPAGWLASEGQSRGAPRNVVSPTS